ncbi:MAG: sulfatase-like hydrolase/transferase [Planctomycetota bacterium]
MQRDFTWTRPASAARGPGPSDRAWQFAEPQPDWTLTRGEASVVEGRLHIFGAPSATLVGPGVGVIDRDALHAVIVRVEARSAARLSLQWSGGLPLELELPASAGAVQEHRVELADLFSVRYVAGAPDLTLNFTGVDDAAGMSVQLESLRFVSDYTIDPGTEVPTRPIDLRGVRRHGMVLAQPDEVQALIPAQAGDRLRFALSLAGGRQPAQLRVRDADGRLAEQRFAVPLGGHWTPWVLELPAAPAAQGLRLILEVVDAGDPGAVVLVGTVLLMRRAPEPAGNLVLYLEDTLRPDRLSVYGHDRATDSHLQTLAAAGLRFERAWSTTNWTRPALSSLMTGVEPVVHGNRWVSTRVPESFVTLAEALGEAGWITASFVSNHHGGSWPGLDQGFDLHLDPEALGADVLSSTLTSALIHDPLSEFVSEHHDEQVFVFAHSLDPHAPYEPGDDTLSRLDALAPGGRFLSDDVVPGTGAALRLYDAEILHNDDSLSRLDTVLGGLNLRDETLVAFVSDHGEAFLEHGQLDHRQTLHEEEVRVPWVMRWPGRIGPGLVRDDPVSLIDVAPTLAGLLGVQAPSGWAGRDLSALARADAPRVTPERLFIESRWDLPNEAGLVGYAAVVAWPFKFIASVDLHEIVLPIGFYDLSVDPGERVNLLGTPQSAAAVADLLEAVKERQRTAAGEPISDDELPPALLERMKQLGYVR